MGDEVTGDEGGTRRAIALLTMGCSWVFDLSALDPELADDLLRRWARCVELEATPSALRVDTEPRTVRVRLGAVDLPDDGSAMVAAGDAQQLPYVLSREVTRLGLTRLRGRATLLHAAALADEEGRAVVFVAPSGGGKSTATRVLGERLGYVSDETVVLLGDGRIAPHPKPPSLVIDPEERWRKEEPAPDDVGLRPTPADPRLAALLTLVRDPEATQSRIEPVGLIEQVLAVLPETSSTWWLDDGLDRLARAVTAGGAPARLVYAEVDTCHEIVREHLRRGDGVPPEWEHLPPVGDERADRDAPAVEMEPGVAEPPSDAGGLLPGDRVQRAPWSDAIACEGEVLLLAGSRPLRLAGPGAAVWRLAREPLTLDELTAAVVDTLGEHPDAAGLVAAAAGGLLNHGLLQRAPHEPHVFRVTR